MCPSAAKAVEGLFLAAWLKPCPTQNLRFLNHHEACALGRPLPHSSKTGCSAALRPVYPVLGGHAWSRRLAEWTARDREITNSGGLARRFFLPGELAQALAAPGAPGFALIEGHPACSLVRFLFRIAGIIKQHCQLDASMTILREVVLGRVSRIQRGSGVVRWKQHQ